MKKKMLFSLLLIPSLLTSCGENQSSVVDVFETPIYAWVGGDTNNENDNSGYCASC